jgi:hypothetical protein
MLDETSNNTFVAQFGTTGIGDAMRFCQFTYEAYLNRVVSISESDLIRTFSCQQYFPEKREKLVTWLEETAGFQLLVVLFEVGIVIGR